MRERRFRARAKITQKMTRHGLVEENRATGEEKRISNRLQDISFEKAGEPEKPALDREGRYYQRTKKIEETTSLTDTRSHRRTKEITVHLQDTHATPLTESNQNQTIRESREDSKPVELRGENFPQGNNNVAVKPDNKQNSGFTVSRSAPQETYLKQKKQAATRYAAPSHSPRENIRSPSGNVQPLENEKVLEQKKYQNSSKESNETSFQLEHGKSNDETPQQSFSSQSKKIQPSPSIRIARDEGKPIKKIVQRSTQYQGRFIGESVNREKLKHTNQSFETVSPTAIENTLLSQPQKFDAAPTIQSELSLPQTRKSDKLEPTIQSKLSLPQARKSDELKPIIQSKFPLHQHIKNNERYPSVTKQESQTFPLQLNTDSETHKNSSKRRTNKAGSQTLLNKKRLYFDSKQVDNRSPPHHETTPPNLNQAGKLRFESDYKQPIGEEKPCSTTKQISTLAEDTAKSLGRLHFEKDKVSSNILPEPEKASEKSPDIPDLQLEKAKRRLDKTQSKLEKAQSKLPTERKIRLQKDYDSSSGKIKHHLCFEKEVKSPNKTNLLGKAVKAIPSTIVFAAHNKIREVERENVGVEAGHKVEQGIETLATQTTRMLYRHVKNTPFRRVTKLERATARANVNYLYQSVLHEHPELKKKRIQRAIQKLRIKRQYAKAARAARGGTKIAKNAIQLVGKAGQALVHFVASFHGIIGMVVIIVFLFFMMASCMSSCGAMLTGAFTSVFIPSVKAEDPEITASDLQWSELEKDTKLEIENAEREHSGYDEYKYILKEGESETETTKEALIEKIQHDPFELIAYLDAMYPDFKHVDIASKLEEIYGKVFHLEFEEETEMRPALDENGEPLINEDGEPMIDENGEPIEIPYRILKIVLQVEEFSEVVREELEQKKVDDLNDAYIDSKGGHQKYGNPLGYYWLDSITSPYGHRENPTGAGWQVHKGVDVAAPMGTPLYAMHNGTVLTAGWHNLFGYTVIVQDDDNRQIRFAHCSALLVTVGQKVKRGENIALVGSTGNSTGSHVHIEVTENGEHLNPLFLLEFTETEEESNAEQ